MVYMLLVVHSLTHISRAESTLILHGVNTAFELFAIMKGRRLHSSTPTKLPMAAIMEKMGYDSSLQPSFPQAFFDRLENRYVISWTSAYEGSDEVATLRAPLFVCASHGNNPMYEWTCWTLKSVPRIHPSVEHCAGQPNANFWTAYPQVSQCGNRRLDSSSSQQALHIYNKLKREAYVFPLTSFHGICARALSCLLVYTAWKHEKRTMKL